MRLARVESARSNCYYHYYYWRCCCIGASSPSSCPSRARREFSLSFFPSQEKRFSEIIGAKRETTKIYQNSNLAQTGLRLALNYGSRPEPLSPSNSTAQIKIITILIRLLLAGPWVGGARISSRERVELRNNGQLREKWLAWPAARQWSKREGELDLVAHWRQAEAFVWSRKASKCGWSKNININIKRKRKRKRSSSSFGASG